MSEAIIFLTGCINPQGMVLTKLQDPIERKRQYIDAIRFYLKETLLRVLFVENSGTDISKDFEQEIAAGKLEVLTFEGNNYNKQLGKGYGEMLIIEHAVNYSTFIKTAERILKITGRYKILNINLFIECFENNKCDLNIDLKYQLTDSDSRFWSSNCSFLKDFLLKYKNKINDSQGVYFEHVLCKATLDAIVHNYTYSQLRTWPRYLGVSGTRNTTDYEKWVWWFAKNIRHKLRYYFTKNI